MRNDLRRILAHHLILSGWHPEALVFRGGAPAVFDHGSVAQVTDASGQRAA
ncbi:MAG TPA: hypothetical protein VH253_13155 [Phycisphaerae bacterium]|nr:hypothetical protein [Phycisphaerae bacterium]